MALDTFSHCPVGLLSDKTKGPDRYGLVGVSWQGRRVSHENFLGDVVL